MSKDRRHEKKHILSYNRVYLKVDDVDILVFFLFPILYIKNRTEADILMSLHLEFKSSFPVSHTI